MENVKQQQQVPANPMVAGVPVQQQGGQFIAQQVPQQVQQIVVLQQQTDITPLLNKFASRCKCWQIVSGIFMVLDLILIISSLINEAYQGAGNVIGLIMWGFWFRSVYLGYKGASTKDSVLVKDAGSNIQVTIVILWIYVILLAIMCAIFGVFLTSDDETVRAIAYVFLIIFGLILLIHIFFLSKAKSIRKDAKELFEAMSKSGQPQQLVANAQPITSAQQPVMAQNIQMAPITSQQQQQN